MAKEPSPDARDQKVTLMLTTAEKDAVRDFARQMGMSLSGAGRYLLLEGLKTKITSDEGE